MWTSSRTSDLNGTWCWPLKIIILNRKLNPTETIWGLGDRGLHSHRKKKEREVTEKESWHQMSPCEFFSSPSIFLPSTILCSPLPASLCHFRKLLQLQRWVVLVMRSWPQWPQPCAVILPLSAHQILLWLLLLLTREETKQPDILQ